MIIIHENLPGKMASIIFDAVFFNEERTKRQIKPLAASMTGEGMPEKKVLELSRPTGFYQKLDVDLIPPRRTF